MISHTDFEDKDGKVDWVAYCKAEIAAGERCSSCGTYLLQFDSANAPQRCVECLGFAADAGKVDHSTLVRCPACKCSWVPHEHEDYDLYREGEHDVTCVKCDVDFVVSTAVSYIHTSPARGDHTGNWLDEDGEE